jgi:hypothetical protein
MDYEPLSYVVDEPLTINSEIIDALSAFRLRPKLEYLPGENSVEERARLSTVVNDLIDRLIRGIKSNPSKLWVMTEFQKALELVYLEATEARERFGTELEEIMDILGVESSDGLLTCYLGGV